jgi:hypothetical protein
MAALVLDASVVLAVALQETNLHLAVPIMTRVADEGAAVPGKAAASWLKLAGLQPL